MAASTSVPIAPSIYPNGYHRLARNMARESGLAIFRRFDESMFLSLMSLQAEILDLEKRFDVQSQRDEGSANSSEREYSGYFFRLRSSVPINGSQHKLLLEIRSKLQEYSRYCAICLLLLTR
jgi:hypothetical protein